MTRRRRGQLAIGLVALVAVLVAAVMVARGRGSSGPGPGGQNTAARPVDFTVTSTDDSPAAVTGIGRCADRAGVCTLRAAVQEGVEEAALHRGPVTIHLGAGTYPLRSPLSVPRGSVTLAGAGRGATILDGGGSSRLVEVAPGGALTLRQMSLRRAQADQEGGAVRAYDASVELDGIEASDCAAGGDGGAVFVAGAALTVRDSTFERDSALAGGALSSLRGSLDIRGSTFSHSTASDAGGAVYVDTASALAIVQSTFSDDSSETSGGAVYVAGAQGTPTFSVDGSTFTGNAALGGNGGAIATDGLVDRVAGGSVRLTSTTLTGNLADRSGGAVYSLGAMTQRGNTVHGNQSSTGIEMDSPAAAAPTVSPSP